MLGALMGSSGAGKTTLLDLLAQRKTQGTINGSVLVDGRPIPVSFQRSAGYVEQLDIHEPLATVREALEFSALLRQPRDYKREERLAYVDHVISLLDMDQYADASFDDLQYCEDALEPSGVCLAPRSSTVRRASANGGVYQCRGGSRLL